MTKRQKLDDFEDGFSSKFRRLDSYPVYPQYYNKNLRFYKSVIYKKETVKLLKKHNIKPLYVYVNPQEEARCLYELRKAQKERNMDIYASKKLKVLACSTALREETYFKLYFEKNGVDRVDLEKHCLNYKTDINHLFRLLEQLCINLNKYKVDRNKIMKIMKSCLMKKKDIKYLFVYLKLLWQYIENLNLKRQKQDIKLKQIPIVILRRLENLKSISTVNLNSEGDIKAFTQCCVHLRRLSFENCTSSPRTDSSVDGMTDSMDIGENEILGGRAQTESDKIESTVIKTTDEREIITEENIDALHTSTYLRNEINLGAKVDTDQKHSLSLNKNETFGDPVSSEKEEMDKMTEVKNSDMFCSSSNRTDCGLKACLINKVKESGEKETPEKNDEIFGDSDRLGRDLCETDEMESQDGGTDSMDESAGEILGSADESDKNERTVIKEADEKQIIVENTEAFDDVTDSRNEIQFETIHTGQKHSPTPDKDDVFHDLDSSEEEEMTEIHTNEAKYSDIVSLTSIKVHCDSMKYSMKEVEETEEKETPKNDEVEIFPGLVSTDDKSETDEIKYVDGKTYSMDTCVDETLRVDADERSDKTEKTVIIETDEKQIIHKNIEVLDEVTDSRNEIERCAKVEIQTEQKRSLTPNKNDGFDSPEKRETTEIHINEATCPDICRSPSTRTDCSVNAYFINELEEAAEKKLPKNNKVDIFGDFDSTEGGKSETDEIKSSDGMRDSMDLCSNEILDASIPYERNKNEIIMIKGTDEMQPIGETSEALHSDGERNEIELRTNVDVDQKRTHKIFGDFESSEKKGIYEMTDAHNNEVRDADNFCASPTRTSRCVVAYLTNEVEKTEKKELSKTDENEIFGVLGSTEGDESETCEIKSPDTVTDSDEIHPGNAHRKSDKNEIIVTASEEKQTSIEENTEVFDKFTFIRDDSFSDFVKEKMDELIEVHARETKDSDIFSSTSTRTDCDIMAFLLNEVEETGEEELPNNNENEMFADSDSMALLSELKDSCAMFLLRALMLPNGGSDDILPSTSAPIVNQT